MNHQGKNLEKMPDSEIVEWHVCEKQFANQNEKGKMNSRRAAAEGTRTAGRRRGGFLRKIHRRGSQDTLDGPDRNELAGLETQGNESKIHHRGSQDTLEGPE